MTHDICFWPNTHTHITDSPFSSQHPPSSSGDLSSLPSFPLPHCRPRCQNDCHQNHHHQDGALERTLCLTHWQHFLLQCPLPIKYAYTLVLLVHLSVCVCLSPPTFFFSAFIVNSSNLEWSLLHFFWSSVLACSSVHSLNSFNLSSFTYNSKSGHPIPLFPPYCFLPALDSCLHPGTSRGAAPVKPHPALD